MGMPSTKAECDEKIAWLKGEIAKHQAALKGNNGYSKDHLRNSIADKKADIAKLQAHKKTLK